MLWSVNHYSECIHRLLQLELRNLLILHTEDLEGIERFLPNTRMTLKRDIARSSIGG